MHIFVEKPVSVLPPEQFESYVEAVEAAQRERGLVVSVGYMFRYHPAVEKMRAVLQQYGRPPIIVNTRYNFAYSSSYNSHWWDKVGGACSCIRSIHSEPHPLVEATLNGLDIFCSGSSSFRMSMLGPLLSRRHTSVTYCATLGGRWPRGVCLPSLCQPVTAAETLATSQPCRQW